jgi:D-serine deaminase-like pyridoxal phosphate-dependent protein
MPCPLSAAPRLAKLARALGPDGLSLMIDHPQQLAVLEHFITSSSPPPLIFVKVGKSRAGKAQDDPALLSLFDAVLSIHAKSGCVVHGLYTHDSSGSYSGSGPQDAMSYLIAELESAQKASELLLARPGTREKLGKRKIVLSVGATPNATSVQNLVLGADRTEAESTQGRRLRELLKDTEFTKVELHAGVYAILDMQQLRTQAVSAPVVGEASSNTDSLPRVEGTLAEKDVAFTVLAEVCSVYTARDTPQALINAGVLALGREPCRGYTGYGVVTDWSSESGASGSKSKVTGRSGWVVGKVSQEHGILIPEAEAGEEGGKGKGDVDTRGWVVGRKVRVVPNHACIAGAGFDFYAVVDGGDVVQDIWIRARGW